MADPEAPRTHVTLDRRMTVGPVTYRVTASGDGVSPIDLSLVAVDADERTVGSLSGDVRPGDLGAVADLLSSAFSGLMAVHGTGSRGRRRPSKQGARWTAEDDGRLIGRYREGAAEATLMQEFGRTRGGIRSRLEHLGEVPPAPAR